MNTVLDRLNIRSIWPRTKGKGVRIGIIDTGVIDHSDLRIVASRDFTGTAPEDTKGHGTSVAGIVAALDNGQQITGIAPEADLYVAKVFSDKGWTEFAEALNWLTDECQVDVVNMSLGTTNYWDNEQAIRNAVAKGVILVAAVGQEGMTDDICYPARHPDVIAVTAVDRDNVVMSKANRGGVIDVAAPGVLIQTLSRFDPYLIYQSGTSFATPVITGCIALYIAMFRQDNGRKPTLAEVRHYLHSNSLDLGPPGPDGIYGYGFFRFPGPPQEEEIILTIDDPVALVNGQEHILDAAPFIVSGRTFVPLRFVGENLGAEVEWDEIKRQVRIRKK